MLPPTAIFLLVIITNKKMAVQQQLGDYNHCKCPLPYQRNTLSQLNPTLRKLSKSQNCLAGPWPDWSLWQWIRTYKEFLLKNHLLLALQTPCCNEHPDNKDSSKITRKNELQMFCLRLNSSPIKWSLETGALKVRREPERLRHGMKVSMATLQAGATPACSCQLAQSHWKTSVENTHLTPYLPMY